MYNTKLQTLHTRCVVGVEVALMKRRMTLIAFGDIALQLQVTSDFHQALKLAFVIVSENIFIRICRQMHRAKCAKQ